MSRRRPSGAAARGSPPARGEFASDGFLLQGLLDLLVAAVAEVLEDLADLAGQGDAQVFRVVELLPVPLLREVADQVFQLGDRRRVDRSLWHSLESRGSSQGVGGPITPPVRSCPGGWRWRSTSQHRVAQTSPAVQPARTSVG